MNFAGLLAVSEKLQRISDQVNTILKTWVGPLFVALGGVGAIYVIILAIQYIKSENDNKRAEAKTRMVNCIIGVLSLLVIGTICLSVNWAELVQMFGYTAYPEDGARLIGRLLIK